MRRLGNILSTLIIASLVAIGFNNFRKSQYSPAVLPPSPTASPTPVIKRVPYGSRKQYTTTVHAENGMFYLNAAANEVTFRFLVDTGAADITFPKSAVPKLGLDFADLHFNKKYLSANGPVFNAPFRLAKLEIGACVITNLYATINGGEFDSPLIGMRLLRQMRQFDIKGDRLTIGC